MQIVLPAIVQTCQWFVEELKARTLTESNASVNNYCPPVEESSLSSDTSGTVGFSSSGIPAQPGGSGVVSAVGTDDQPDSQGVVPGLMRIMTSLQTPKLHNVIGLSVWDGRKVLGDSTFADIPPGITMIMILYSLV